MIVVSISLDYKKDKVGGWLLGEKDKMCLEGFVFRMEMYFYLYVLRGRKWYRRRPRL
jgi:hypothetical protein